MNSNNRFTYLLYALLGGLVLAAGYMVLEKRKEANRRAEEIRRDNYVLDSINRQGAIDTTGNTGSAYTGESKPTTTTQPTNAKPGIEDEPTGAAKPAPTTATKPTTTTPTSTTKPAPAAPTAATKPAAPAPTTSKPKTLVSKGGTSTSKSVAPVTSGRYLVKVGVFSQVANARAEMEKFVKMGYQGAEVVKYKNDTWCVAAKRTASRSEADQLKTDLAHRGIDAQVIDTKK
jgi:cell division septation protein DedD